ncbi:MAG TPA: glycosyltransferase N-terminal domain-containing protein, partial [Chitinophagaceae bacterium]|nr:glycosyltransferase N-terminal domain-containing protein [Chitinophagaceae bacterium]
MSLFFYNIFLWLFRAGTHIASLFNPKAKKWIRGRKKIFEKLEEAIPAGEKIIWVHCASLGEFEQGRPVIEKLGVEYTGHKILLTFFSPSGYEIQKNYKGADWVFYLPLDGPRTAKRFLEIVHPSLVIFVKYEFWFYYLKKIKYRNIPLLLISALFRKDMSFFKWYGKLQRKMLSRFDHLFVQNASSKELVEEIGLGAICSVSGDTRFDRVLEIASAAKPIPEIEKFIAGNKTIIAGSTWPEDEEVFQKAFFSLTDLSLKLIIAPHEINEKHITDIKKLFPDSVLFSELFIARNDATTQDPRLTTVLIIDNIGILSRLYQYATICYVGGGMKKNGVHNVLEAAVWYKPVLFGSFYHKYTEAVGLAASGGGLPFHNESGDGIMLKELIMGLLVNKEEYEARSEAAGEFVRS